MHRWKSTCAPNNKLTPESFRLSGTDSHRGHGITPSRSCGALTATSRHSVYVRVLTGISGITQVHAALFGYSDNILYVFQEVCAKQRGDGY